MSFSTVVQLMPLKAMVHTFIRRCFASLCWFVLHVHTRAAISPRDFSVNILTRSLSAAPWSCASWFLWIAQALLRVRHSSSSSMLFLQHSAQSGHGRNSGITPGKEAAHQSVHGAPVPGKLLSTKFYYLLIFLKCTQLHFFVLALQAARL